jgi:hypothetical protein
VRRDTVRFEVEHTRPLQLGIYGTIKASAAQVSADGMARLVVQVDGEPRALAIKLDPDQAERLAEALAPQLVERLKAHDAETASQIQRDLTHQRPDGT